MRDRGFASDLDFLDRQLAQESVFKQALSVEGRRNLVMISTHREILFNDFAQRERVERLEDAIESIRVRFGKRSIYQAVLMGDLKMPGRGVHEVTMPGVMYQ